MESGVYSYAEEISFIFTLLLGLPGRRQTLNTRAHQYDQQLNCTTIMHKRISLALPPSTSCSKYWFPARSEPTSFLVLVLTFHRVLNQDIGAWGVCRFNAESAIMDKCWISQNWWRGVVITVRHPLCQLWPRHKKLRALRDKMATTTTWLD